MLSRSFQSKGFVIPSFVSLRLSICAVLGLSAAACGGNVMVETGDGGSGGGTNTTANTTATTTTGGNSVCAGAVPVMQADGSPSGYEKCPDGTIHRVVAVPCNAAVPACQFNENEVYCKSDSDCTAAPNGRCAHYESSDGGGDAYTFCDCAYPCENDGQCDPGQACICPGVVPLNNAWAQCASAECLTNANCASGECGVSSYYDGCGYDTALACRNTGDVCRVAADCQDGYQCVAPYGSAQWSCEGSNCAVGRPLTVDGHIRTAGRMERGDWSNAPRVPEVAHLSDSLRADLGRYWREVAALEHASIASFARFSLELLAMGAPPDLLLRAHAAGMDEIVHAQIAYRLANVYMCASDGPAPLDVSDVRPAQNPCQIVAALVEEACVGETVGAAEARALSTMVTDAALVDAYTRIAEDEAKHAELGWATLAWMLRTGGQDVKNAARAAFDRSMAKMSADPFVEYTEAAPHHGLLSGAMLGGVRRRVVAEVIAPCVQGLFGEIEAQA
ncbi:MAG: ferritin-like domain-containing protein [Polyangiaceae bacterium]|nr:ferritin-like domain-containing protein [Polyangiaceae bacterium]